MPQYQASMDMGAYVVVLNAEKVVVSGNKFETKMYRRHTGRPGQPQGGDLQEAAGGAFCARQSPAAQHCRSC